MILARAATSPDDGVDPTRRTGAAGFTLLELLVVVAMLALLTAIVAPNLGALLPSTRLSSSGKQFLRTLDWVRSEARIQARRMAIELDLSHARWRVVHPPEMRLTRDEADSDLEEWSFNWQDLEEQVVFDSAGDARRGLAKSGIYRMEFDEHGFTSDQLVVMRLENDPKALWGLSIRGLTGLTNVTESDKGERPELSYVEEGAF